MIQSNLIRKNAEWLDKRLFVKWIALLFREKDLNSNKKRQICIDENYTSSELFNKIFVGTALFLRQEENCQDWGPMRFISEKIDSE